MIKKILVSFAAVPMLLYPAAINGIGSSSEVFDPFKDLSHAEEIWISALEWCESQGNPEAINPMDSDGTPSYYSFQFKEETFSWLAVKYGVISKGHTYEEIMTFMKRNYLQRAVVRGMIKDKNLNLRTQFPGCVKKNGLPPLYPY